MTKYYVYTLAYPPEMGGAIFYVGKGKGPRMKVHEWEAMRSGTEERHKIIRAILDAGYQVNKCKVLETDDEQTAYQEERALIDRIDLTALTNIRPGCVAVKTERVISRELQHKTQKFTADKMVPFRGQLRELVQVYGQVQIAERLNTYQSNVWQWTKGKNISWRICQSIFALYDQEVLARRLAGDQDHEDLPVLDARTDNAPLDE